MRRRRKRRSIEKQHRVTEKAGGEAEKLQEVERRNEGSRRRPSKPDPTPGQAPSPTASHDSSVVSLRLIASATVLH